MRLVVSYLLCILTFQIENVISNFCDNQGKCPDWLPKNYSSKVLPNKPTKISADFRIDRIRSMGDLDEFYSMTVSILLTWVDSRLKHIKETK